MTLSLEKHGSTTGIYCHIYPNCSDPAKPQSPFKYLSTHAAEMPINSFMTSSVMGMAEIYLYVKLNENILNIIANKLSPCYCVLHNALLLM